MRNTLLAILAVSSSLLPANAWAFATETLGAQGDPSSRINLVIMGDGYRAEDQTLLRTRATAAADYFFSEEPLRSYRNYFNVKLIHTISDSDGALLGDKAPTKSTIFQSSFGADTSTERRLVVGSEAAVTDVLFQDAPEFASGMDIALVLVNDTKYGGSGGRYPTVSAADAAVNIAVHEIGHSFAGLADEYEYDSDPDLAAQFCKFFPLQDWTEPNVTFYDNPSKWDTWIDDKTLRIPMLDDHHHDGVVGMFKGGKCAFGYRPTSSCIMRSFDNPVFCPVCRQAMVLSIYHKVRTDAFTPSQQSIGLAAGASQSFVYTGPTPTPNTLVTTWSVDNRTSSVGDQFTVTSNGLGAGPHTITASVVDQTAQVRSDPEGRRLTSRTWNVVVSAPAACTADTATDLGQPSRQVTVPSNACVKVSAYPQWWGSRTLNLQASGGRYPLAATWTDFCTKATGSVSYASAWQTTTVGAHASSCPAVIQLNGDGSPVTLSWW